MDWSSYFLRRIVSSTGVLVALLLFSFYLSRFAFGDPVYTFLAANDDLEASDANFMKSYRETATKLGLDLPSFYFTICPKHYPDTLYRLQPLARKVQAKNLLLAGLDWSHIQDFQKEVWQFTIDEYKEYHILTEVAPLKHYDSLRQKKSLLDFSKRGEASLIPKIVWNGSNNAFWFFVKGIFSGTWGYSLQSNEAVLPMLLTAFKTTLLISVISGLLSVLLGSILGLYIQRFKSRITRLVCFLLVSIPGVWILTFATTQFSGRGKLFPGPGWIFDSWSEWVQHATLPILIMTIPSIAYIALTADDSLGQKDTVPIRDFARLRGITENKLWFGDMLRLGVVPGVVSIVGLMLPQFFAGSLAIEYIFNIPGIGSLVVGSILDRDWPVVLGIVIFSGVFTIVGFIFIDLVNAYLDPRQRKLNEHVG